MRDILENTGRKSGECESNTFIDQVFPEAIKIANPED
jgi:hypothetical protein